MKTLSDCKALIQKENRAFQKGSSNQGGLGIWSWVFKMCIYLAFYAPFPAFASSPVYTGNRSWRPSSQKVLPNNLQYLLTVKQNVERYILLIELRQP